MTRSEYKHASAIIWRGVGVLFIGEPGSGKSSFAAEFVTRGGELVGDDQLLICEENGKLFADAPPQLAGVLELRNVGLIKMPYVASTQIHLVIECGSGPSEVKQYELFNIILPCIRMDITQAANVSKIMLYAEALHEGRVLPEDWKP